MIHRPDEGHDTLSCNLEQVCTDIRHEQDVSSQVRQRSRFVIVNTCAIENDIDRQGIGVDGFEDLVTRKSRRVVDESVIWIEGNGFAVEALVPIQQERRRSISDARRFARCTIDLAGRSG